MFGSETPRHVNFAQFPHERYSEALINAKVRFHNPSDISNRFSLNADKITPPYGVLVEWDATDSWLKFDNMALEALYVSTLNHTNVDDMFSAGRDLDIPFKMCRLLAFKFASGAVEKKMGIYPVTTPIYIKGHHTDRAVPLQEMNEKRLTLHLHEVPEPFASAIMQTCQQYKLFRASWDVQKELVNEMSALLFAYTQDLFCNHTDHVLHMTKVPKCCDCKSYNVEDEITAETDIIPK